jgi:hypothetical protein
MVPSARKRQSSWRFLRMSRPEDYLMAELRAAQKALTASKKRGNTKKIAEHQARIAELQKERG